jgi:cysteinyl-tRNA synthetase
MEIFIHNTANGKREKFVPIEKGKVSMYNCGPTVYDYAHIGNLRSYVFSDILRRMFEYNKYDVKQIINITDIGHLTSDGDSGEDKMTKALKRKKKPFTKEAMREVADYYFDKFKKDLKALNIKSPEGFPFASDNIQEDIDLILKLKDGGYTYDTSDGIYFDTQKFPDYGKFGNFGETQTPESRIGENTEKRNFRDFALWKWNKELGFSAPFGNGFPGWHLECSAMSVKYLGPEFDVHTGGIDHVSVHHPNEIAQAVCAGYPYAHYWMHNAYYNIAGENGSEKMAKSGENFITLRVLKKKKIDPLALRFVFLGARYSSPLQFSWESLDGAQNSLTKLRVKFQELKDKTVDSLEDPKKVLKNYKNQFNEAINDDLDTPKALSLLYEVLKDEVLGDQDKKKLLSNFDKVLGLKLSKKEKKVDLPEEVENLIKERDLARNNKDFQKSDEIRAKIEEMGFVVNDTPEGTNVSSK